MELTITVSEKTEKIIREKAMENSKDISDFAGNLLEEKVKEDFPEIIEDNSSENYQNPFTPFIGMFASGKTDTSEKMSEILYSEDFNPAEGFNVKK